MKKDVLLWVNPLLLLRLLRLTEHSPDVVAQLGLDVAIGGLEEVDGEVHELAPVDLALVILPHGYHLRDGEGGGGGGET